MSKASVTFPTEMAKIVMALHARIRRLLFDLSPSGDCIRWEACTAARELDIIQSLLSNATASLRSPLQTPFVWAYVFDWRHCIHSLWFASLALDVNDSPEGGSYFNVAGFNEFATDLRSMWIQRDLGHLLHELKGLKSDDLIAPARAQQPIEHDRPHLDLKLNVASRKLSRVGKDVEIELTNMQFQLISVMHRAGAECDAEAWKQVFVGKVPGNITKAISDLRVALGPLDVTVSDPPYRLVEGRKSAGTKKGAGKKSNNFSR